MSTTLTDFLREQAEKRKDEMAERQAVLEEWFASLNRLYGTVQGWVRDADPDHILTVKEGKRSITEERLGTYTAPRIDIHGFGQWVAGFVPKARYTVGTITLPRTSTPVRATGRVDITDDARRYVLYRYPADTGDGWVIEDLKGPARPFNREAFETAMMSYLR